MATHTRPPTRRAGRVIVLRAAYTDLGANGLMFERSGNQPWDTADVAGKSYAFDGDWGKARISRDEYTKVYEAADERYSRMLEALLAELKKTS